LAYAPPFGSAKDPINMLGYMAENLVSGLTETVQWDELDERLANGAILLDVRSKAEFNRGHIPTALNISVDNLRERLTEIPNGELVIYCQVGQRGHTATLLLREYGFNATNLDGGYQTWVHSPAGSAIR